MKKVQLDTRQITDWLTFHEQFREKLGFPEVYKGTMEDWVDCMASLVGPGSGPMSLTLNKGEILAIELSDSDNFLNRCGEQFVSLVECGAEVNRRYNELGSASAIAFVFR